MNADAVFAASAVERRAVADLLDGLDERQLATPSLCAGWDVRTMAAHLVGAVALGGKEFVRAMVRARGRPDRANDVLARDVARRPVAELAEHGGVRAGRAAGRAARSGRPGAGGARRMTPDLADVEAPADVGSQE